MYVIVMLPSIGTFLGVPSTRNAAYQGLDEGPRIAGNYLTFDVQLAGRQNQRISSHMSHGLNSLNKRVI